MKLVRMLILAALSAGCAVTAISPSAGKTLTYNHQGKLTYKAVPCFGYAKRKYVYDTAWRYIYELQRDCSYRYIGKQSLIH